MAFKTNAILKRLYLKRGAQTVDFNQKTDKFISDYKTKRVLNNYLRRINLIPTQVQIKPSNYNLINYWFIFVRFRKKILKLKVKDHIYRLWLKKKRAKRRKKKWTIKKSVYCFLQHKNPDNWLSLRLFREWRKEKKIRKSLKKQSLSKLRQKQIKLTEFYLYKIKKIIKKIEKKNKKIKINKKQKKVWKKFQKYLAFLQVQRVWSKNFGKPLRQQIYYSNFDKLFSKQFNKIKRNLKQQKRKVLFKNKNELKYIGNNKILFLKKHDSFINIKKKYSKILQKKKLKKNNNFIKINKNSVNKTYLSKQQNNFNISRNTFSQNINFLINQKIINEKKFRFILLQKDALMKIKRKKKKWLGIEEWWNKKPEKKKKTNNWKKKKFVKKHKLTQENKTKKKYVLNNQKETINVNVQAFDSIQKKNQNLINKNNQKTNIVINNKSKSKNIDEKQKTNTKKTHK